MEYYVLANGNQVPKIAYGTWDISGDVARESVVLALKTGYREIDTAAFYFNEKEVGEGIRQSGLAREDVFVASKIWYTENDPKLVRAAFQQSLDNLGLDYIDLYLIHWPLNDYVGTWKVLKELQDEGKICNLGVCNCQIHHLQKLEEETGVRPLVNQFESNPTFQQQKLVDYCNEKGILVQAWGPLGKGRLLGHPTLVELAEKYGRSPAQIVLRWHMQRGVQPLPKSTHVERLEENLNVFDFQLSAEDMAKIAAMETGVSNRNYMPGYEWE